MNTLKFPKSFENSRYFLVHYYFFLEYAKLANIKISVVDDTDTIFTYGSDKAYFSCEINNQQVIVDFSDFSNWNFKKNNIPYIKFQSNQKTKIDCISVGPPIVGISFETARATMDDYFSLRKNFNYTPGIKICNKQSPHGNAVERRSKVKEILLENFNDIDLHSKGYQIDFWKTHEDCLVAVCVPGATNNMVDRGHMELIGLGVCTVSPKVDTLFPYNKILQPNVHYLECNSDYSNLAEIINWAAEHKSDCKQIGINARNFFDSYFSPSSYWAWILKNLKND
jgi:hypothetical protein